MKPLHPHIIDRMEVKPKYVEEPHKTPTWKYFVVWLPYAVAIGVVAALVANWLAQVLGH